MSKQELAIAKKIAEIEGVKSPTFRMPFDEYIGRHYNPFDWSILGPLMVKHEIEVDYVDSSAYIRSNESAYKCWALFSCKEEVPRAILECIIKSQEV